jgi:hypothetical protein
MENQQNWIVMAIEANGALTRSSGGFRLESHKSANSLCLPGILRQMRIRPPMLAVLGAGLAAIGLRASWRRSARHAIETDSSAESQSISGSSESNASAKQKTSRRAKHAARSAAQPAKQGLRKGRHSSRAWEQVKDSAEGPGGEPSATEGPVSGGESSAHPASK